MNKRFLIIKTGSTLPSLLALGEDFEAWFVWEAGLVTDDVVVCSIHLHEKLPDLATVDGIIVTGSPAFLTDFESWNSIAAEYLRSAHAQDIPILGVCYGHQLVAWAFGGTVDFHPRGREIGTVAIELTACGRDDQLFASLPDSFKVQTSHLQSVTKLPAEAVLLAGNDFEPNHAFRIGQSTWGLQFHPEFSEDIIRAYITERREVISEEGMNPDFLLQQIEPTPEAASMLTRFVNVVEVKTQSSKL